MGRERGGSGPYGARATRRGPADTIDAMTWLWVAVVVAVLGVVIAILVGRISGGAMPEVAPDRPAAQLSSAPLTDVDLAGIRFTQNLRGYAMDEVDDFIERVRAELASRPRLDALPAPTVPSAGTAVVDDEPVESESDQPVEPDSVDVDARP
jgi:DivIVA domain-containing protein